MEGALGMTYRNPALLSLAVKAPHCMLCMSSNDGSVVAAHSNSQSDGKGMGMKASDACVAFLCFTCHTEIDQGPQARSWKRDAWLDAYRATMRWLIESGHLLVSLVPAPPPVVAVKPKAKIAKGAPIQSRGFAKTAAPQKIPRRPFPRRISITSEGAALEPKEG